MSCSHPCSATNDGKYIVDMAGGAVIANDSVRAVHLVFVTFNIWGERLTGLRVSKVEDVDAGKPVPIHDGWYLRDADIQEFATSVAYVDRVLLADGSTWRADRAAVARILSETSYRISEASLDPDSRKGANP